MGRQPATDTKGETQSALASFEQLGCLEVGASFARLMRYNWSVPTADLWTSDSYFLHMCLSSRNGPAQAAYLETGNRVSGDLGKVMFVPPGMTIKSGGSSGSQLSLICSLAPELIEQLLERPPVWHANTLAKGLRLMSAEVDWFLLRIYREITHPGFAGEKMAEALINGLAIALLRALKLDQEGRSQPLGGLAPWRLRLIEDRVHAPLSSPRLTELAELCGMSVRHLGRAFKVETGKTLGQFVESVTVERAMKMLNESDAPVAQIAESLGFASRSSFVFSFRRATGSSPLEVRAAARRPRRPDNAAPVDDGAMFGGASG